MKHYKKLNIECIDLILEHNLDFAAGNAVKYFWRYPHKSNVIGDLEKCYNYLLLCTDKNLPVIRVDTGCIELNHFLRSTLEEKKDLIVMLLDYVPAPQFEPATIQRFQNTIPK